MSSFHDGSGRLVALVADNGPAISSDQRDKVFVPFYTIKRKDNRVSLTLVRQIAIAQGAGAGITDARVGGTTVYIRRWKHSEFIEKGIVLKQPAFER